MKKIFNILLLGSSLSYGQSFFDTSIAGGVNLDFNPLAAVEIRYNQRTVDRVWISLSGNFEVEGVPTNKQGLTHTFDLKVYPRLGLTASPFKWIHTTVGASIASKSDKGFWPYPYSRTDLRVLSTDQGSISGIVDLQIDRAMIGISFKSI